MTDAQKRALLKYQKEKLKRIPLDVHKDFYPQIVEAASSCNESVAGYIKKAIMIRMQEGW